MLTLRNLTRSTARYRSPSPFGKRNNTNVTYNRKFKSTTQNNNILNTSKRCYKSPNVSQIRKISNKLNSFNSLYRNNNYLFYSTVIHPKIKDCNESTNNRLITRYKHKKKYKNYLKLRNLITQPLFTPLSFYPKKTGTTKTQKHYFSSSSVNTKEETNDKDVTIDSLLDSSAIGTSSMSDSRYRRRGVSSTMYTDTQEPNDITQDNIINNLENKNDNNNNRSNSSKKDTQTSSSGSSNMEQQAAVMFELIWKEIVLEKELQNMIFPKEIMWLAGAPGSGKSVMREFIMNNQGIETKPIEIGQLLKSPKMESIKSRGGLISDREVIKLLLSTLLSEEYSGKNVLVDGYPRTPVQAHCIKLLFDKMLWLRRQFENTSYFHLFRRPVFHITVLYVDESVSVQRQLKRGRETLEQNQRVDRSGVGDIMHIRATDIDAKKAHERYKIFKQELYNSLNVVKEKFPFHFINAEGSVESVQKSVVKELQYQSEQELADETFDNVRQIKLANEIKKEARHNLVKRLDNYQRNHKQLFNEVIQYIKNTWMRLITKQALTGTLIIRTEDDIFFKENGLGITMALDVLTERGYKVILDYVRDPTPKKVNLETGEIISQDRRIFVFTIRWPPPKIRHSVIGSEGATYDGWDNFVV